MGNKNDKKERINVVYSTNPNYQYEYNQEKEQETLAPEKQNRYSRTRFHRDGRGFERTSETTKKQMRRGWFREGWRNYHPRRSKRKSIDHSSGQ